MRKEDQETEILNKTESIWNLSIPQICNNLVDSLVGIADDLSRGKKQSITDLFSRENRLTYVGLTLVVVGILLWVSLKGKQKQVVLIPGLEPT